MSRPRRSPPKPSGGIPADLPLPPGMNVNPELLAQMLRVSTPGKEGFVVSPSGAAAAAAAREADESEDRSRWQVLYPAYLNKKYTEKKGRRVNKSIAVENPTVQEMKMICDHAGVPAHIEPHKRYPRDWLLSQGRLRVKILNEDGNPFCADIPNKKKLMHQMCLLIPKLKTRAAQPPQQASAGGGKKKKKK